MSRWRWDAKRREYIADDGRVIGPDALLAIRDGLADGFEEIATDIVMRHASGEITATQFEGEFRAFIDEATWAQYLLGRGGANAATTDDFETMARLIADQLGYAEQFAASLFAGELTPDAASARAELYAGATVSAFEQGMAAAYDGIDLPDYPAAGNTSCLSRCRCFWTIDEFPDRYEATWNTVGDGAVCPECAANGQRWAPFVQMKTAVGQ